ncbi:MAG: hypothetical protein HOJ13_03760 [Nitrospina sp.]|nr:hypothetical protein [Nitrospina sp.]
MRINFSPSGTKIAPSISIAGLTLSKHFAPETPHPSQHCVPEELHPESRINTQSKGKSSFSVHGVLRIPDALSFQLVA